MLEEERTNILVLIDWSNISLNMEQLFMAAGKHSLIEGFDKIQRQILNDTGGEIAIVFVFAPPHLLPSEAEAFYKQGFYVIYCPRTKTKGGEEKDTTDETLIEFLKDVINHMPNITHICLGSGDKDFCQALRKALRKNLKLIIMAGDITSLSADLIDLADSNPKTGKKMVHLFSPVRE